MTTRIERYYGLCVYDTKSSSWYTTKLFLLIQRGSNDNTTVVVFTAPRFFLVTRIRDDKYDTTTVVVVTSPRLGVIILRSLCLRHQDSFWKHEYAMTRMITITITLVIVIDSCRRRIW